MMEGSEPRIEFVNRVAELAILEELLAPAQLPGLVLLRAPKGIGKTRLTDELALRCSPDLPFARVDPILRPQAGPSVVYEGFFLQRCAEAIDELARTGAPAGLEDIESFLRERRWTAVREKKLGETLHKFPSWENLYGVAFEYVERLFVFGRFGREQLLGSDTREAVATCQAYVEAMIERAKLVLVVRQAELLDHLSLKALLAFNRSAAANLLILEYASADFSFSADHDKIFEQELSLHANARIFQLLKLEPQHLELFLRQLALPSQVVEWSTSAHWDGDLRRLTQFQHVMTVHTPLGGRRALPRLQGPADLEEALVGQVEALSTSERVLLAMVAADPLRIDRTTILQVAHRLIPHETRVRLNMLLDRLLGERQLLVERDDAVGFADADLLPVITRAAGFQAARVLAEAALRDFYAQSLRNPGGAAVSPATAMRKALTLAARTDDPQMLIELLDECSDRIAAANDQTIYVDLVASVAQSEGLLPSERRKLTRWAAALAYDICDFRSCRMLLSGLADRNVEEVILLASCMIEDGDHQAARTELAGLDRARSSQLILVADLIEGSIALDAGGWNVARMLLRRVASEGAEIAPAIAAHALRLLPELLSHPECTSIALESVERFEQYGLDRCAAYSAMSAARFLAREGRINEARALIAKTDALRGSVRDEHMIRNNRALLDLLSESPELANAVAELRLALRTSRDDFSDLSILCNLAIAQAAAGALEEALDCVARGIAILDAPGFAERDVFWPACFNFGWVLDLAGRSEEAAAVRRRPYQSSWRQRSNDAYWAWRYGESDALDEELPYLRRFPYHPVALSHWQLDREALATLTEAPPR